ncbi:MAG: hypothetical protein ACM3L8_02735 [Verrucomicrobiota bacterium]
MGDKRGYALVVAMLILLLFGAIGIYVASLPFPAGRNVRRHELEAVARNMAKAGANAAIARLPEVIPGGAPYLRNFRVTPGLTGRYAVWSRRLEKSIAATPARGGEQGDYEVFAEGGVEQAPGMKYRVHVVIRYSSGSAEGQITQWEESAL